MQIPGPEQHFIPKTYLRRFQIDEAQNKGMVYLINYLDHYQHKPVRKGLKAKEFFGENYYNNDNLEIPSAIDTIIKDDFEDNYYKIVESVTKEERLVAEVFNNFIGWLWVSKVRSPYYRTMAEHFISLQEESRNIDDTRELNIEEQIDKESQPRNFHTQLFFKPDITELYKNYFVPSLVSRKWRVLKASLSNPFITNDNPGFTATVTKLPIDSTSFSPILKACPNAIIYYVISPIYCVEISPFHYGVAISWSDTVIDIPYQQASEELINTINSGVFFTKVKLLISNSKEALLTIANRHKIGTTS